MTDRKPHNRNVGYVCETRNQRTHLPIRSANMQTKRTLISLNKDALERLLREGRKITHYQKSSTNECLYALLGEYSSLRALADAANHRAQENCQPLPKS